VADKKPIILKGQYIGNNINEKGEVYDDDKYKGYIRSNGDYMEGGNYKGNMSDSTTI